MHKAMIWIDHENVHHFDLKLVPEDVGVTVFFGSTQQSISRDLFTAALQLGDRFAKIDIEGDGKNALDFHLAFYLGEYLAKSPTTECVILSKDKGFTTLVKHLRGRGFKIRQAATLAEALPANPHQGGFEADYSKAVANLRKGNKNARPRKRATLLKHVGNLFKTTRTEAEVAAIVERMFAERVVTESGTTLTYVD